MSPKQSREEFFQNLSDSGLFPQEEVSRTRATLSEGEAPDGNAAAQRLVASGKLTPFQADAVRERRFEGLVIGNYEVLDRLGQGGVGTVFKARHRRMRRIVALKILSKNVAQSEQFIKRFQREVEAISRLNHPNIIIAHDADESEVGPYLVMEFVDGRDLASEVQEHGPMPVREALACIVQAAWALEYAHGQGIIHRDIKPANLLRDASGVVKLADLGLARFDESVGPSPEKASALTQAGTIMGTVAFMPPEQAVGLTSIDHRADIYSLGCTLYFLLLGKPPFEGPTMVATLLQHREAPIPSMTAVRPEIPAELDAIFRRMLAKSPADRYQSMTEVVKALEAAETALREQGAAPATGFVLDLESSEQTGTTGAGALEKTIVGATPSVVPETVMVVPPANISESGRKALLVEPSRTQSAIIRKYLQTRGFQQVTAVATGQEALQAVRRERPEVVLSAFHLADMTGTQLAEKIHGELHPAAPGFILISSEAESAEAGSLSKCGKAVVLKKPFTQEHLVDALRLVFPELAPGPQATQVGISPGQQDRSAGRSRGQLRTLIVDDSAAARVHVRNVLTKQGLSQFAEAADGADAVAAVAVGKFDLIITDYNMPHMDGRGLVGYLKQNPATANIPIIMVTTEDDPGKLEAVRRLGVAAVCDKSFPAQVVEKVIEQLVNTP
jgi:serine/threonine protein kinase/DNA-binding NarL/FixJ family response regulator